MRLKISALAAALIVLAGIADAQAPSPQQSATESFLGIVTLPLWDGETPDAKGTTPTDIPTLTVFKPFDGTANGSAVIIAPGGGYLGLAANHEGRQVADWFASRGVTAFVLRYRLGRKYPFPIPLMDAQRAIRLVRTRAKEFNVVPNRIGMIGFSAGGHLTATAGTIFDKGKSDSSDPIERAGSRLDFIILGYPWLNAMKPNQGLGYCKLLSIDAEKCKSLEQYSPDERITAETPPTFIYQTSDDQLTAVEGSTAFYVALRKVGISAEMHIFAKGPHGSGLGNGDPALGLWTQPLEAWLRAQGFLTIDPTIAAAQKGPAAAAPRKPGEPFTIDLSLKELLANADARKIVVAQLGQEFLNGIPEVVHQFGLRQILQNENFKATPEKIQAIERELVKVPVPR